MGSRPLTLAVLAASLACAGSRPAEVAPSAEEVVRDETLASAPEGSAGETDRGDAELDAGDYLVQTAPNEYRVGRHDGAGVPRGTATFAVAAGGTARSAAFYRTVKAKGSDAREGETACFFRDTETDGVFQKPASKREARSGLWSCRAVQDVATLPAGHVVAGNRKVAADNLRLPR